MIDNYDTLRLDIDLRLRWLWETMEEVGEPFDMENVAAFVRAAYGQGWTDALKEPHGKLAAENGFRVPPKLDEPTK